MAKLVDLLAKHLAEWPDVAEYARQDADKEVCFDSQIGFGISTEWDFFLTEIAEDAELDGAIGTKKVYMKDWLAARDRLHAETVKGMYVSGVLEAQEFDADQALWDKVAVAALQSLMPIYWEESYQYDSGKQLVKCQVESAFEYADAFMAERDKRLKGGV